jgi:hypothetical protein
MYIPEEQTAFMNFHNKVELRDDKQLQIFIHEFNVNILRDIVSITLREPYVVIRYVACYWPR